MTTDLDTGGPFTPERTKEVANLAAECIRYLNHASLNAKAGEALREPADLDRVISDLATMTMRLPQLLSQLGNWLAAEAHAGHLAVVSGEYQDDPRLAAHMVRLDLDTAMARLGEASGSLDSAYQITSAIAAADSGEDEEKADG